MGERTLDVSTSIRQLMVDRAEAVDALVREKAARLGAEADLAIQLNASRACQHLVDELNEVIGTEKATVERLQAALRKVTETREYSDAIHIAYAALSREPRKMSNETAKQQAHNQILVARVKGVSTSPGTPKSDRPALKRTSRR